MIEVLVSAPDDAVVEGIRTAVEQTARECGFPDGEISVTLLDDSAMQAMNRDHLGHDYITDVISFDLWDEGEPVVGDIYIGAEQAARQALEAGVDVDLELLRLAVHGTLHVLGWDHPDGADERAKSEMYQLQERILVELTAPGLDR